MLVVVGVVVLTGCQTTVWVRVEVDRDGAGSVVVEVSLDAEAAEAVGDLSAMVATDDLQAAGWQVFGPAAPAVVAEQRGVGAPPADEVEAGAVTMRLERRFADVDQANRILASLSGPEGPLRDVRLSRSSSTFQVTTGFAGTVDLSGGWDSFADPALVETLGGSLDRTVAASGGPVPGGEDLVVGLQLGSSSKMSWSGQRGDGSTGGDSVAVSVGLGQGPESVRVDSVHTRWAGVVAAVAVGGLVLAGVAAVVVLVVRRAGGVARRGPGRM